GLGGFASGPDRDYGRDRERGDHRPGDRGLNERDHPSGGDRRTRLPEARPAPFRRDLTAHAYARGHPSFGPLPDGGFLLRGGTAGAAGGDRRPAAPGGPDGNGAPAGGPAGGCEGEQSRGDPAARQPAGDGGGH